MLSSAIEHSLDLVDIEIIILSFLQAYKCGTEAN